jgi:cell division GTPase FtsZ
MNKEIVLVGLGNAGGQVANRCEIKYPEIFDCVYINSSEADLAMVKTEDGLKFKIGDKAEIEGSGKNRAKMKEYLCNDISNILGDTKLQKLISNKKYCFVISSTAGGTGSGAAPVMMELLREMFPDTNFILVAILPTLGASLMEQGNALEFLTELYDVLGSNTTYMIYDNETAADLPPTKALSVVNECIVEDLRVLSGIDNYATPYESIDAADMESIITTPGRLIVVRINSDLTEKNMEDANLDQMIVKAMKRSSHAETDRNKKVVRWGIITFFTEEVNKLYNPTMNGVVEFIGTPIERFNHNAINTGKESSNFLYMIASGLSPINDRVNRITQRIDQLKAALAEDDANKYILAGEGASYSTLMDRKKADRRNNQAEAVDPQAIFKKFMK